MRDCLPRAGDRAACPGLVLERSHCEGIFPIWVASLPGLRSRGSGNSFSWSSAQRRQDCGGSAGGRVFVRTRMWGVYRGDQSFLQRGQACRGLPARLGQPPCHLPLTEPEDVTYPQPHVEEGSGSRGSSGRTPWRACWVTSCLLAQPFLCHRLRCGGVTATAHIYKRQDLGSTQRPRLPPRPAVAALGSGSEGAGLRGQRLVPVPGPAWPASPSACPLLFCVSFLKGWDPSPGPQGPGAGTGPTFLECLHGLHLIMLSGGC